MKISPPPAAFSKIGLSNREAFSHEIAVIPKRYPDSILHLLQQKFSVAAIKLGRFYQLNLYATDIAQFPELLFTDTSINWHGQQCSKAGLVAAAGIFISAENYAVVTTLQSDLCQQLYRNPVLKRACKTQVDTRYGVWYRLLMNAIIDFCTDNVIEVLLVPTANTVFKRLAIHTSPAIFARIYDDPGLWLCCSRHAFNGIEYWEIKINSNNDLIVTLEQASDTPPKSLFGLCIFHDIEGAVDTQVSASDCTEWTQTMLELEAEHGLSPTYSVVGNQLASIKPLLERYSIESLAFHSYDHQIGSTNQLQRVRDMDLKVRGYRPPQSKITPELTNFNLSFYNFEWLLSSVGSLNTIEPILDNYIVKIPVHLDDYQLHTGELSIFQWMDHLQCLLNSSITLVSVGLHDCYAGSWLDYYPEILKLSIANRKIWNCDEIASTVYYNSFIK